MASRVNIDTLKHRFARITDEADIQMALANKEGALILQREVVARVPVGNAPPRPKRKHRAGDTRAAFADPEAVGLSRKKKGGWVFGLRTKRLQQLGYIAPWIEFGTKGYKPGDKRSYKTFGAQGVQRFGKNGKPIGRPRKGLLTRSATITRTIPARPARPFFRPGVDAAMSEIRARQRRALEIAVRLRRG